MRISSAHGRSIAVGEGRTALMGVLNLTPDSFSDGGRWQHPEGAVARALQMVEDGAVIVDLGGESTRPGYRPVPPETQLERVLPVLQRVRARSDVVISVDTTRAAVAEAALSEGADWINDTSALQEDAALAEVAARHGCPIVLMHRFEPPRFRDEAPTAPRAVAATVADRLRRRMEAATAAGIDRSRILLDPGIGFGTLPEDNVALCAHVAEIARLGRPLVIGPSRKSFLGRLTGRPVAERLAATAAAVAALALEGVEVLRVHDVAEMQDVVRVADALRAAREA